MTTTTAEKTTTSAAGQIRAGRGGVVVVQRRSNKPHMGQGLAKGMAVVIKHFADALLKRNDSRDEISGMFTVEYPEEVLALPETYRNMPVLLYDDETGHELCTSCFQCERVCPPQVIHITQAKNPETGKPVPAAAEFIIEYDSCMSCGYCAEVCPFDAIKMDHYFELSTPNHLAMDVHKEALNRPVSYYATIAPNLWAEVRDTALKKLQNNIKRRPGTIGVAPQALGKVAAKTPAAKVAPGAAPGAQAAPSAAPAKPVAAIGKNMPPEKVARLEAIRAANRARRGAAAGAPSHHEQQVQLAEEPVLSSAPPQGAAGPGAAPGLGGAAPSTGPGEDMPSDKRARLEAIRAANRARREGEGPAAADAPVQSAAEPAPVQDGAVPAAEPDKDMPDEKRARLEAIRAANRARRREQEGS
ncbi:MAG: 4Fe-4S ferredoxin [Herpetosiphonaceae bacterium]|nr:MAG: 4Fe-4S ferredoxin [Herpetosiphonaceae bacterium]